MTGSPRIVYLTPALPYPRTSGMAIRQFHLLRAYADWARVTLVGFYDDEAQLRSAAHLHGLCEAVHGVPFSTTRAEAVLAKCPQWQQKLTIACAPRSELAARMLSEDMKRLVDSVVDRADLIHVARLTWFLT